MAQKTYTESDKLNAEVAKPEAERVKLESESRFLNTRQAILKAQFRINMAGLVVALIAAVATVARITGS